MPTISSPTSVAKQLTAYTTTASLAQAMAARLPGSMLTGNATTGFTVTLPAVATEPTAAGVAAVIAGVTVAGGKVILPASQSRVLDVKPNSDGTWGTPHVTVAERNALTAMSGWVRWNVAPGGAVPGVANGVNSGDIVMTGGVELDPSVTLTLSATGRTITATAAATPSTAGTATIARYLFEATSTSPAVTRTDSAGTGSATATFSAAADGAVTIAVIAVDSDGRTSRSAVKTISVTSVAWIATDAFTGSGALVGRAMDNTLGGSRSVTPTGTGAGAAPVIASGQAELTYPYTLTYPIPEKNVEVSFEVGAVAGTFHLYSYYANAENFCRATIAWNSTSSTRKLNIAAKAGGAYVAGTTVDLADGDVVTLGWDSTMQGCKLTITRASTVFWTATSAASLNGLFTVPQVGVVIESAVAGKQHLDNLTIKAVAA